MSDRSSVSRNVTLQLHPHNAQNHRVAVKPGAQCGKQWPATPVDFVVMLSSDDCEGVPFEIGIETLKWTFPNGDYVTVERNTSGYFISGRVGGKDWHDEDHEDFFCADTDEYLDFLEKHGLLGMLSVSPSA